MRRKLLIALTLLSVAAAGAFAGWGDVLKGALKVTTGAPKKESTNAAVRGLDEGDSKGSDGRDFKSVDKLDDAQPSEDEVEKFVKEGGLE